MRDHFTGRLLPKKGIKKIKIKAGQEPGGECGIERDISDVALFGGSDLYVQKESAEAKTSKS